MALIDHIEGERLGFKAGGVDEAAEGAQRLRVRLGADAERERPSTTVPSS